MGEPMKPDPNEPSVVASQNEEVARLLFEAAFQTMVLNGLSDQYKLLIVAQHPNGNEFVVGSLDYQVGVDILNKYIAKRVASSKAAEDAIKKLRGKDNG